MSTESRPINEELRGILAFLGAIWAVYLLSFVVPSIDQFGIVPRTFRGLIGIPAMPFLHANFSHILSNTIPLLVLLILLAGSRARSWEIVVDITLTTGLLLWVFGRSAIHLGASGLIFGLITFLIFSGVFERRLLPLLMSVLVGFLYGGSLLLGLLPGLRSDVSWDGHLCGAIAGVLVAYALIPARPRKLVG